MNDPYAEPSHAPSRPAYQGESIGSLLLGAVIFGYAGFALGWASVPAAQFAMWSLRVLAIGFAVALVLILVAPRIGAAVRLLVIGLAAVLLCGAGAWLLVVTGGRDLFGWLLIIMGVFDGMEIVRYRAARRARGG